MTNPRIDNSAPGKRSLRYKPAHRRKPGGSFDMHALKRRQRRRQARARLRTMLRERGE